MLKEHAAGGEESRLQDDSATDKADDAGEALRELGDDAHAYGYFTSTITVWDRDLQQVQQKMRLVKQAVQSRGLTVQDETLNSREAWLSSLPGHVYANVRRPIVSTMNLAHLIPVSSIWSGEARNEHLETVSGVGLPHVQCTTTGSNPFYLNLNVRDVGHTLIIGRTGSGKSTLLSILALQWPKYPGARVIILDKDRSARAATLAMGGAIFEPGNEAAPVAFQPLRDLATRADRTWASQFVLALFAAQGVRETPLLKEHIEGALDGLASYDAGDRTLSTLVHLLASFDGAHAQALQPYFGRGSFAQIFDAAHDSLTTSHWTMVEMGPLMSLGPAAILPALLYLFHRFDHQFTGAPTLVVLDEAWVFLGHPIFAQYLQAWLKTLRKKNVFIIFATQEVADATNNPILHSTILSACSTTIFLADPKAPELSKQYEGLGLSPTEIQTIAGMAQKRDYYYRSEVGRRVFSLSLGPAQLAFAGMSGAGDQQELDRIVASRPPAEHAEALLEHRRVEWAVAELRARRTGT
jgi:type IV secretion/conjugal transfer VirB4 family ATPase